MTALERVAQEGSRRGHAVRIHRLSAMPEHWQGSYVRRTFGVYGRQSPDVDHRMSRCEVALVPSADETLAALALAHEIGHGDQDTLEGYQFGLGYDRRKPRRMALIEQDAWHRALVLWGELGFELTPELASFVLACLFSYDVHKWDPGSDLLHWLYDYAA